MPQKLEDLSKEQLLDIIEKQAEKLKNKKYGLVWDAEKEPEKIVVDCQNNVPILKDIKSREISSDDGNDNILIEGDNYHALTCLNYTHKGKIDVIYIDPPYNTGKKDEWKYNDRYVDENDTYKHSKWLNMMSKRLELAKNLLKNTGVIFISIDEHEQPNLRLLLNRIFSEGNYVGDIIRKTKSTTADTKNGFNNQHEYLLVYAKDSDKLILHGDNKNLDNYKNPDNDPNGPWVSGDPSAKSGGVGTFFPIVNPYTKRETWPPKGRFWAFSRKTLCEYIELGKIKFKKDYKKNERGFIFKRYKKDQEKLAETLNSLFADENTFMNQAATKEANEILPVGSFEYPKPVSYILSLINSSSKKDSIILDFFAGSGTTGQAVLELNKEDGGNRKFILCTNNEGNICTEVCYPRLSKVIKGYKKNGNGDKVEGLGGNLKYLKTDLIPVDRLDNISDRKRVEITKNAGEMVGLKEDTLEQVELNNFYQILTNKKGNKLTAIYFRENEKKLEELINKIGNKKTVLYVFSYGKVDRKMYKGLAKNITIEDIPEPIIEIYREINLKIEDK